LVEGLIFQINPAWRPPNGKEVSMAAASFPVPDEVAVDELARACQVFFI
jgi:hypothetical protein